MIGHVEVEIDEDDVQAGGREAFQDGDFYDWEYRRRRDDVRFYRSLVRERGGPVLDLGCGTGRLLVPLLRDGHSVLGVDLSDAMLRGAQARLERAGRSARTRGALVQGDMTKLRVVPGLPRSPYFGVALCAFHGLQHIATAKKLASFFRQVSTRLLPRGWLIFDLFLPAADFLARDPSRTWDRTVFRHPLTQQRTEYTLRQRHDPRRRLLLMEMCYQSLGAKDRPTGPIRVVRLCHRLWSPPEIDRHLETAGFRALARYAAFDGTPWSEEEGRASEQIIYVARPERL